MKEGGDTPFLSQCQCMYLKPLSPGIICNLLSLAYVAYICPFNAWWCDVERQFRAKKWQVMPGKYHRHHLPKGSGRETTAYELLAIK